MKKTTLLCVGTLALIVLTGCASSGSSYADALSIDPGQGQAVAEYFSKSDEERAASAFLSEASEQNSILMAILGALAVIIIFLIVMTVKKRRKN